MSVTITVLSDEANMSWGPMIVSLISLTGDSSYPTGGYGTSLGVTASNCYCGRGINAMTWAGNNTAAAGYIALWNTQTLKLQIFTGTAGTPAGTIGAITPAGTIGGNVTVKGGTLGEAIGINPDTNAGVLSKAAATDRTIPIATLLGAAPTFTGTPVTPVFTGSAGAAGPLAELTNGTDISLFTWVLVVYGQR